MSAKEADVETASPVMRSMLLGALLGLACMADAQAQRYLNGPAGDDAAAQRMAPEAGDRAGRGAVDHLQGLHGDPDALLGAPPAFDDPYRAAYDAANQAEDVLTNTQRVPRGALAGGRYAQRPAAQGPGRAAPLPGIAGKDDAREAKINQADPGTQTPTGAALSVYHGPGDVGKAVGQVYKMPW